MWWTIEYSTSMRPFQQTAESEHKQGDCERFERLSKRVLSLCTEALRHPLLEMHYMIHVLRRERGSQ